MRTAPNKVEQERVELFKYPASSHTSSTPEWLGWGASSDSDQTELQDHERTDPSAETAVSPAFEMRIAEEKRRSFELGYERGRQEGLQSEREAHGAAQKAAEQRQLHQHAELVATFAEERNRYLQAVEQEVVKLALAVAARILRREAQMDPLLLSGAVRVALGQLSGSTEVRLRVPANDIDLWTEAISLVPNLGLKPKVISDQAMRLGDCIVETSMGSADLGVRSQLGEIERGFFDRAGTAPTDPPPPNSPAQASADLSEAVR